MIEEDEVVIASLPVLLSLTYQEKSAHQRTSM